jgi:hypothetical protein
MDEKEQSVARNRQTQGKRNDQEQRRAGKAFL